MSIISLKDYAKQSNVSYEAVRQQVNRYRDELGQHLVKDGRQQFLDEEAVAFLDSKREKSPVVIVQQDKDDRIQNLENENKALLLKTVQLQDLLLKEKDERLMIAEKVAKVELLEAGRAEAELALEETRERLKTAEGVAELNAQEAAEAKQRAADLAAELERISNFSWRELRKYKRGKKHEKKRKTEEDS